VNKPDLLAIYRRMRLIREVESQISIRYHEGQMRCPTHLSIGQEAPPSVLSEYLTHADYAVSTHRSHAHYLAKGGDVEAMLAEIYGLPEGCSMGRGGSMHLADKSVGFMGSSAIVGNSIPVGVGLGHAAKLEDKGRLAVVYIGDAAVEEGVFYESANFAATAELPVLFLCENNGFSVYTAFDGRQPKGREIHQMVGAIGLESSHASSYNFNELLERTGYAVNYIRESGRPYFLEIETMRYLEHCGPNDDSHLGYRNDEDVEQTKLRDPLSQLAQALRDDGKDPGEINTQIENRVQMAFEKIQDLLNSGLVEGEKK
jgi:TPP-dependent pyruvate/acetoin dehydrogenase alpha subunit